MAGYFELKKASNGEFHFNLHAGNSQVVLSSELYAAKASALNGIASVQANHAQDARYERAESSNGKWYFTLKAANHQVIGKSQMYASAASRDAGIESVKANGGSTEVRDLT
jgi:uncharacterized protein YegP (UPF0339 family)